jgi:hypothetical protein
VGDALAVTRVTPKQDDAMASIAWGMHYFGSLVTNRQFTRAMARALVKKGLAESVGIVDLCDGDGFTVQHDAREGFVLTERGLACVEAADPLNTDLQGARECLSRRAVAALRGATETGEGA